MPLPAALSFGISSEKCWLLQIEPKAGQLGFGRASSIFQKDRVAPSCCCKNRFPGGVSLQSQCAYDDPEVIAVKAGYGARHIEIHRKRPARWEKAASSERSLAGRSEAEAVCFSAGSARSNSMED